MKKTKDVCKICKMCHKSKQLSEFSKHKTTKDKRQTFCKQCNNKIQRKFTKTKIGIVNIIYNTQKTHTIIRKYPKHQYTKDQLKKWLFSQDLFHKLFDNWVNSGYKKDLKPSIDRKNDYKGYSLDNIQLMTWDENNKKGYSSRKNGINNKLSKAVMQYDLKGNFIKEYYSTKHAEIETGIWQQNISKACCGIYKTAGKFIWKHKNS